MKAIPDAVMQRIQAWLDGPYDEKTKQEIRQKLEKDPQDLIDAFFTDLSFGTGGLRGLMGVGTSRLNRYTIQMATQGLAQHLKKKSSKSSVLIGFDSRIHSKEFAEEAACVLAANGIHVYLLPEIRPTPYISFACRYKKCDAAIMITASHNPKEYNGYKVYNSFGGQVVHPEDTEILSEVASIRSITQVKLTPLNSPLIEIVDLRLDLVYLNAIRPLQHFPKENHLNGSSIGIAYTSLHGTGITIVPQALKDWGFNQIHFVDAQIQPDGNFPTVKFPNPEYPEALELGIKKMIETKSSVLIANDPDADRIGIAVMHQDKPVILNGNEVAALCFDYLCQFLKTSKALNKPPAFVISIVTTELAKKIAEKNGFSCFEVLTGFKYIAEKIHEWEIDQSHHFVFGAEESYGYLLGGDCAHDKDAIITSCLIAEMVLHSKQKGQTLVDCLHDIYKRYGIYREKQHSLNFKPGKEGMEEMSSLMQKLRKSPPSQIGTQKVVQLEDYISLTSYDMGSSQTKPLFLPKTDMLLLRLQDGSKLVIRPSGTEPKLKIYASTNLNQYSDIPSGISDCDGKLKTMIESLEKMLK